LLRSMIQLVGIGLTHWQLWYFFRDDSFQTLAKC
jgi:hypothetical protein